MTAPSTSQVVALLLAAGASRRFGSDKRLARLDDGRPLLGTCLANARSAFADVRVVLRVDDPPAALGIAPDTPVIRSEQAHLGMGHSLAAGVRALADSPAEAVAILLADMPWLQVDTLVQLAARASAQHIVLPLCDGHRGHPVIIGRHFWPMLETLSGDQGARAVVAAHPQAWINVPCNDRGTLLDADTPTALSQALRDRSV
ncbi:nucleotidyltransferase family protein [uncultured Pseudomonas sp.]|uniref:nucleotidyltransferase family protein n=1 Tax=uncultured Pseudomonas sp. TaxID=114707 RepID=UPI0025DF0B57|nr:nucleotidyltransferase family protein [uncultured Pseudomonas sp.]